MPLLRPLLLCALAVVALAAADLREEATLTKADGASQQIWVILETLDDVEFSLTSDAPASSKLKRAQVLSLRYGPAPDNDYNTGEGELGKKQFDRAATRFIAAQGSPYRRVRELAFIGAAEALRAAKKFDDALKQLAALEAAAPRSVHLPRALQLRVEILLEKGDSAGAEKAIEAVRKIDPVRAAVVLANLRRAADPAAAAKELQAVWATAPRTAGPDAPGYDSVGLQLATDLAAAKQTAQAQEVLAKLCFAAASPGARAQAHIALARSLGEAADKATLLRALDHALMGGVVNGGDRGAAKRAAQAILGKLDKDPAAAAEASEYRQYVNAL